MSSCISSSTLRTKRHNCIAIRLVRAICFLTKAPHKTIEQLENSFWDGKTNSIALAPDSEILWNCSIRDSGISNIHPDVAFIDKRSMRAFVIDVCVVFEASANFFSDARLDKYTLPIAPDQTQTIWLSNIFLSVRHWCFEAWDERNTKLYSDLRLSTRCKKFFKKNSVWRMR